jgi:hypothetical protein
MPTGYTASVAEGKLTAREYLLSCSRAFGALIHLRDESFDSPIVMREESTYHRDRLRVLNAELEEFNALTVEEAQAKMNAEYDAALRYYAERVDENKTTKQNYEDMLAQVEKWNPPTPEHNGLKEFAISQIKESLAFDCYTPEPPKRATDVSVWMSDRLRKLTKDVKYHVEENEKEMKRTYDANAWITSLIEALPK